MQFTQYWSVWLLTLVPGQRILGNRVWSRDVLIALIWDSLLKAARHSLASSQKIRNPIIDDILIRLVFTPGKPQSRGPGGSAVYTLWLVSRMGPGMGVIWLAVSFLGEGRSQRMPSHLMWDHIIEMDELIPNLAKRTRKFHGKHLSENMMECSHFCFLNKHNFSKGTLCLCA